MEQPDVLAQMQVLETFQSLAPLLDRSLKLAPNPNAKENQKSPPQQTKWRGSELSPCFRS